MDILIWIGTGLTIVGLAGLAYCIIAALRARRAGLSDDDLRARLQGIVAVNLGAVGFSALGLMLVVAGIILG
jgi:hypothetical protein